MAETKEELKTLAVSGIPQRLIDDIDKLAAVEIRTRSNHTRILLEEIVAIKKSAKRKGGGGNRTRLEAA